MSTQLASRAAAEFVPDCYCMTRAGSLMPARMVEATPNAYAGVSVTVTSPQGTEYTFPGESVFSPEEAREALHNYRVGQVVSSYEFETLRVDRSGMVVRCWNPAHPIRSNYILTIGRGRETCSCPAFAKDGSTCKHLQAHARLCEEKDPRIAARRREQEEAQAVSRHAERQLARSASPIRQYDSETW